MTATTTATAPATERATAPPGPRLGRGVVALLLATIPIVAQLHAQQFDRPFTTNFALLSLAVVIVFIARKDETIFAVCILTVAAAVLAWWRHDGPLGWESLAFGGAAIVLATAASRAPDRPHLGIYRRAVAAAAAASLYLAITFTAQTWLFVRNFGLVGMGLLLLALIATGSAALMPADARERTTSVLLLPAVAAGLVLVVTVGLIEAFAFVFGALACWVVALVRPSRWRPVERAAARVVRPIDDLLERIDRVVNAAVDALARIPAPVLRVVRRAFELIAHVIATVLLVVVWVLLVAIPGLLQWLFLWDPLDAPRRSGSRWITLTSDDSDALRMWSPEHGDPRLVRRARRRHLRVPAALIVGVSSVLILHAVTKPTGEREADSAIASGPTTITVPERADWEDELNDAWIAMANGTEVHAFAGPELPEVKSRYLNIADGERRTWAPEIDACRPRRVVWLVGASTALGLNQRDVHTIGSELARQAWKDGVALEVHTMGVPGDTAWQEHQRLVRRFEGSSARPDLVVFYDGYNDVLAQQWAMEVGEGGPGTFVALHEELLLLLDHLQRSTGGLGAPRYQLDQEATPKRPVDPKTAGQAAAQQYVAADGWSRELLDSMDIPMVRFFQPSLNTRAPHVEDPDQSADRMTSLQVVRDELPTGVVDISGVFDDIDGAMFTDEVHTHEVANPPIAKAMFTALKPELADVETRTEASCS